MEQKRVEAAPMTLGEWVAKTNRMPYGPERMKEHSEEEPGYHVKYEDGYESWSPTEAFEKAYLIADTAIDRMEIESGELAEKAQKLADFTHTKKFAEFDADTQAMLYAQYNLMMQYLSILYMRENKMKNGTGNVKFVSFGVAISLLECGFVVRRAGWNDKGLSIIKQVPAHIKAETVPNMQSLPEYGKKLILGTTGHIDYTSQCLIFNENTGRADSWTPSISDVFATDWELVTV